MIFFFPHKARWWILLLLFLVAGRTWIPAYSQDLSRERISIRSDSLHVTVFIRMLEEDYRLRVFYDPAMMSDTLWTRADLRNIPVRSAIDTLFSQLDIHTFHSGRHLYLTGSLRVRPGFSESFIRQMQRESARPEGGISPVLTHAEEEENGFEEYEVIRFGIPGASTRSTRFELSGRVTDRLTGEPVIGATIQVSGMGLGTATDQQGQYALLIPSGNHEIAVRAIGKRTTHRQIALHSAGSLDVKLQDEINELEEVVVIGKTNDRIHSLAGSESLDLSLVRKSVLVMGETDILKGILSMPGVQTITEVSNGFNVRGGSTDQNMILLDGAPVMNAAHFFGFFSSFNSDLVEDATLYKSGIPAGKGGRISSILDVTSRDGDMEHLGLSGGLSPVTARLNVEGPLVRDRVSFIAGGRSTYSDWLLNRVNDNRINNSSAYFYDGFVNVHAKLGDRSTLSGSLYHSNDYFDFDQFLTHQYANLAGSLRFRRQIAPGRKFRSTFTYSTYEFSVTDKYNPASASASSFDLMQAGWSSRYNHRFNRWVNLEAGLEGIYYSSSPGRIDPAGDQSLVRPVALEEEQALEISPYLQNEQHPARWLSLSYGIRFSGFVHLGPGTVYLYDPRYSRSVPTMTDTLRFGPGEPVQTYGGPEWRFLAKFTTGKNTSVKISYNRMRQYIHLISNTISPAPTDIWKLSDSHFLPQAGDQVSAGYFRDLVRKPDRIISVSLEAYYKYTRQILDFKTGADLFANDHFETEVMRGVNRSYGIEMQLNKERGSLYGWINYTYARTQNRFRSPHPEETINSGSWYPANHDKPHQVKAVVNYDFYRRLSLSANVNYSTGRPVTLPVNAFLIGGGKRIQFAERNKHRLPDYFRMDLSATLDGRYNLEKLGHGSFTLSLVNVTGRKNPYSIFFQYDERGRLKSYYLSIFGVPIVTLTYNFRF